MMSEFDLRAENDVPSGQIGKTLTFTRTSRRRFLLQVTAAIAAFTLGPRFLALAQAAAAGATNTADLSTHDVVLVRLRLLGKDYAIHQLDPRVAVLELS